MLSCDQSKGTLATEILGDAYRLEKYIKHFCPRRPSLPHNPSQFAINSGKEGSRLEKVVDRGILLLAGADGG
jgi:hypothetical protein